MVVLQYLSATKKSVLHRFLETMGREKVLTAPISKFIFFGDHISVSNFFFFFALNSNKLHYSFNN